MSKRSARTSCTRSAFAVNRRLGPRRPRTRAERTPRPWSAQTNAARLERAPAGYAAPVFRHPLRGGRRPELIEEPMQRSRPIVTSAKWQVSSHHISPRQRALGREQIEVQGLDRRALLMHRGRRTLAPFGVPVSRIPTKLEESSASVGGSHRRGPARAVSRGRAARQNQPRDNFGLDGHRTVRATVSARPRHLQAVLNRQARTLRAATG